MEERKDIFDWMDQRTRQREEELELRQKELIAAFYKTADAILKLSIREQPDIAMAISRAMKDMKSPYVTVTVPETTPVSYIFIPHRNSKGYIEYITAEVINK